MLTEYRVATLDSLPRPSPFREDCLRVESRTRCNNCWYHSVDWRAANAIAIEVLTTRGSVMDLHGAAAAVAALASSPELEWGSWSLFAFPIVVSDPIAGHSPHYIDGQHRVQAMLDQGVELVVIERHPPTDPRVRAQEDR